MIPLPFESFHVYELKPGAPDHFVISITSATYADRREHQFLTVVPLRDFSIRYDHPLLVIVDPLQNRDVDIPTEKAAYVGAVQSLPQHILFPQSRGEVSERVKQELRRKLSGYLDLQEA